MFLSLPFVSAAVGAAVLTLIVRADGRSGSDASNSGDPLAGFDGVGDSVSVDQNCTFVSTDTSCDKEYGYHDLNISNTRYKPSVNFLANFCDRLNGKPSESSAVVFEDNDGNLSAWISSAPFLDANITDADHVALSLTDAMRSVPRLVVTYACSEETKQRIEHIANKICLLSPNERQGIFAEKSKLS